MKKSEIVKHFEKEGIVQRTIYKTIDRMQDEGSIKEKNKTDRPTSWTAARRSQLKKLANIQKGGSQRRLDRKFGLDRSVVSRKFLKWAFLITNVKNNNILRYRGKKQRIIAKDCQFILSIIM